MFKAGMSGGLPLYERRGGASKGPTAIGGGR